MLLDTRALSSLGKTEILRFLLLNKRNIISLQNYKTSIMHAKFMSFQVFTLPVHMSCVNREAKKLSNPGPWKTFQWYPHAG